MTIEASAPNAGGAYPLAKSNGIIVPTVGINTLGVSTRLLGGVDVAGTMQISVYSPNGDLLDNIGDTGNINVSFYEYVRANITSPSWAATSRMEVTFSFVN